MGIRPRTTAAHLAAAAARNTTMMARAGVWLLLLCGGAVSAFQPMMHPTARGAVQVRHPSSSRIVRRVVADFAEQEEAQKNNSDDGAAWTRTRNGGFLPNLGLWRRRRRDDVVPPVSEPVEKPRKQRKPPQVAPPRIQQVTTIQDYKAVVVDEPDKLVCVRFYAPWCRACKAVQMPFAKLARDNASVKFVEVPLTEDNAFLHEGLGIPSLPFGHIYHPEVGLVEERKLNKKVFGEFKQVLQTYVDGSCEMNYDDEEREEPAGLDSVLE